SVLPGKGDGTFGVAQNYPVGFGPQALAVGDFNGDGSADLAVANAASGSVSILLNRGDGTFQLAQNYSAGSGPNFVAVGDFNGDGRLDLVTTNFFAVNVPPNGVQVVESDLNVFLGNGDGTFQAPQVYAAGLGPVAVAVGDFNHDNRADLAVTNFFGGNVSILLGNGDGTFQAAQNF